MRAVLWLLALVMMSICVGTHGYAEDVRLRVKSVALPEKGPALQVELELSNAEEASAQYVMVKAVRRETRNEDIRDEIFEDGTHATVSRKTIHATSNTALTMEIVTQDTEKRIITSRSIAYPQVKPVLLERGASCVFKVNVDLCKELLAHTSGEVRLSFVLHCPKTEAQYSFGADWALLAGAFTTQSYLLSSATLNALKAACKTYAETNTSGRAPSSDDRLPEKKDGAKERK